MTKKYELIEEKVLSGSAAAVSFTSIPSTYIDLVVKWTAKTTQSSANVYVRFNGDQTSSYDATSVYTDGSSVASSDLHTYSAMAVDRLYANPSSTSWASGQIDIFSYTLGIFKPVYFQTSNPAGGVVFGTGRWIKTAAISEVSIFITNYEFGAGSTFSLYGI